jgi:hypothetical protein
MMAPPFREAVKVEAWFQQLNDSSAVILAMTFEIEDTKASLPWAERCSIAIITILYCHKYGGRGANMRFAETWYNLPSAGKKKWLSAYFDATAISLPRPAKA